MQLTVIIIKLLLCLNVFEYKIESTSKVVHLILR